MKVVGLDVTTGTRSNFGVAIVDFSKSETNPELILAYDFPVTKSPDLRVRIKYIAAQLVAQFKKLEELDEPYLIVIENTILPGKANQQLQRVIGAILTVTSSKRQIIEVYPTQVKLHITGEGKGGDKKIVADALKKWFNSNEVLFQLTASKRYDATDAIGIAITGFKLNKGPNREMHVQKPKELRNAKPSAAKQKKRP